MHPGGNWGEGGSVRAFGAIVEYMALLAALAPRARYFSLWRTKKSTQKKIAPGGAKTPVSQLILGPTLPDAASMPRRAVACILAGDPFGAFTQNGLRVGRASRGFNFLEQKLQQRWGSLRSHQPTGPFCIFMGQFVGRIRRQP